MRVQDFREVWEENVLNNGRRALPPHLGHLIGPLSCSRIDRVSCTSRSHLSQKYSYTGMTNSPRIKDGTDDAASRCPAMLCAPSRNAYDLGPLPSPSTPYASLRCCPQRSRETPSTSGVSEGSGIRRSWARGGSRAQAPHLPPPSRTGGRS